MDFVFFSHNDYRFSHFKTCAEQNGGCFFLVAQAKIDFENSLSYFICALKSAMFGMLILVK